MNSGWNEWAKSVGWWWWWGGNLREGAGEKETERQREIEIG